MAKAVISSTFSPSKATSDEGVGYFMGYDMGAPRQDREFMILFSGIN